MRSRESRGEVRVHQWPARGKNFWNRSWQTREKQLGHAIRFFEVRVPPENEGVDPSAAYS
jgi:hypothetical protein